jgi:hypothetical protein
MILQKLKTYWTAIVAVAFSALAVAVKLLSVRNRKLRQQRDQAAEGLDHAREVIENDIEVREQVDTRLAEAAQEIAAGSAPSELTNPNDDWLR